jgi:hypothetical protein
MTDAPVHIETTLAVGLHVDTMLNLCRADFHQVLLKYAGEKLIYKPVFDCQILHMQNQTCRHPQIRFKRSLKVHSYIKHDSSVILHDLDMDYSVEDVILKKVTRAG